MTTALQPPITLALEPLDVLFFRDGRPFAPGAVLTSGRPVPQTLAGALRTWILEAKGCDFKALGEAVRKGQSFGEALAAQSSALGALADMAIRGPWFTCNGQPVVPVPATLRRIERDNDHPERIVRLNPFKDPMPGWRSELGEKPLWWRGKGRLNPLGDAFLTMAGLAQFLNGKDPQPETVLRDLLAYDRRVGIQIASATQTVVDGALFSAGFLALKPGVGLAAEIRLPKETGLEIPAATVLPLGGAGRRVAVTRREPLAWPRPQKHTAPAKHRLLLLTTPALFEANEAQNAWKPPGLQPKAAAVPRPEPVSGWDLALRGPKPLRFAVPAGAVYFLDSPAGAHDAMTTDSWVSGSLCTGETAAAGWGAFIEGVWDYA